MTVKQELLSSAVPRRKVLRGYNMTGKRQALNPQNSSMYTCPCLPEESLYMDTPCLSCTTDPRNDGQEEFN